MNTLHTLLIGLPRIFFLIIKGVAQMMGASSTHVIYEQVEKLITVEMFTSEYKKEQEDVYSVDGSKVYLVHDGYRNKADNVLSQFVVGTNLEKGYSYVVVGDDQIERVTARCKINGLRIAPAAKGLMIETRYGNILTGYHGQMLEEGYELVSLVVHDYEFRLREGFKVCVELSNELTKCYQKAFNLIRADYVGGHYNPIKVVSF